MCALLHTSHHSSSIMKFVINILLFKLLLFMKHPIITCLGICMTKIIQTFPAFLTKISKVDILSIFCSLSDSFHQRFDHLNHELSNYNLSSEHKPSVIIILYSVLCNYIVSTLHQSFLWFHTNWQFWLVSFGLDFCPSVWGGVGTNEYCIGNDSSDGNSHRCRSRTNLYTTASIPIRWCSRTGQLENLILKVLKSLWRPWNLK